MEKFIFFKHDLFYRNLFGLFLTQRILSSSGTFDDFSDLILIANILLLSQFGGEYSQNRLII